MDQQQKKKKLDIAFSVNQATRFSKNSIEARYSNIKNTLKVSITPYLDKYVTKKKKKKKHYHNILYTYNF